MIFSVYERGRSMAVQMLFRDDSGIGSLDRELGGGLPMPVFIVWRNDEESMEPSLNRFFSLSEKNICSKEVVSPPVRRFHLRMDTFLFTSTNTPPRSKITA